MPWQDWPTVYNLWRMWRLGSLLVGVLLLGSWALGAKPLWRVEARYYRYEVVLVPYATTVLRFSEGVRYVATGWPYVQVGVLEGSMVLLRPLVREGEGELWVMLQDGREYRLRMVVKEGTTGKTYRF